MFFVFFYYFVPFFVRLFLKLSIQFHGQGTEVRDFVQSIFLVLLFAQCASFLFGLCALSEVPQELRLFVAWKGVHSGSTASKAGS